MVRGYSAEGLDDVIAAVRGTPFAQTRGIVNERTSYLLSFGSSPLEPIAHAVLDACYYRAVQVYATAGQRRLQGDYLQHPEEVVAILRARNVSDAVLLGVGLLHDGIEEQLAAERKKRKIQLAEEQRKSDSLFIDLLHALARDFSVLEPFGASAQFRYTLAEQVCEPVGLMTRPSGEQYYRSIGSIFRPGTLVHPESKVRAIINKSADREANTNRLDSQAYTDPGAAFNLQFDNIITAIERNKGIVPENLRGLAYAAAKTHPEDAPFEYSSAERLYQCFKNLVFITEYRLMRLAGTRIAEVHHLNLAQATKREADKVVNHNCTYHAPDRTLGLRKIWEISNEEKAYQQAGGFDRITHALPSRGRHKGFDGIFKTFFDTRVHGNKEILEYMQHDKALLVRVGRAISIICDRYIQDDMYILRGLSAAGLELSPAVGK